MYCCTQLSKVSPRTLFANGEPSRGKASRGKASSGETGERALSTLLNARSSSSVSGETGKSREVSDVFDRRSVLKYCQFLVLLFTSCTHLDIWALRFDAHLNLKKFLIS